MSILYQFVELLNCTLVELHAYERFVLETNAFRATNERVGNTRSNFSHTHTQLATKQKLCRDDC